MFNFNLLLKKVKKLLISINELIESFFNTIQKIINFKKKKNYIKNIDNKIPLGGGLIILTILSYLLIPTFYDKTRIQSLVQNYVNEKYNLDIKFNSQLSYGLFPKPHFFSKDLSILYKENEIAISKSFKVNISMKNFFSFDKIKMNNVLFKKTEFNIDSNSIIFFKQIFLSKKNGDKIIFKDSKVFYKDKDGELLFLSKVKDLDFLIDQENLSDNKMNLNFEIFNIPLSLSIINNDIEKKFFSKLKSRKVRLKIENEFDYGKTERNGLLNLQIINDYHSFNYLINEDSLNFISNDKKFKGQIDFKPFYYTSDFNFNQLNINDMFDDNSILSNLVNSQIFNNQNLNANFNLKFKKTSKSNYLKDFIIKLYLQEGRFIIKDSSVVWNESILINLDEVELVNGDNQIKLIGEVSFYFKDITKFYSYYQIRRNHRFNIKSMKIDFVYDLSQEKITLDNLKIDKKEIKNINSFLEYFNTQNRNIFNKVTFRNFIKDFFSNYEG